MYNYNIGEVNNAIFGDNAKMLVKQYSKQDTVSSDEVGTD